MKSPVANKFPIGLKSFIIIAESIQSFISSHNIINSSVSEIYNLPIVQDNSTGIPSNMKTYVERLTKEEIVVILKEL